MADKNYYPQPAGDGSATEAAKHVVTIDVEVPAGHGSDPPANAAACAGPYYPGNAKAIFVVATANGVDFYMRGTGGSGGAAIDAMRELNMAADVQPASNTKCGLINAEMMPHEFFLWDTSAGANVCTMYWIY